MVGDPNGNDGTEVVKRMLEAGKEEAIKVDYCWNDPNDDSDNAAV